jgi:predicted ATPase/DNA-binding XRE family transcriptional regulator
MHAAQRAPRFLFAERTVRPFRTPVRNRRVEQGVPWYSGADLGELVTESVATFGELLRQHRRAARLTQEELAERAGLSVHGVQKLERGATHPYRDTAQRLLQALQLPPDELARFTAAIKPVRRRARPHEPAPGGEARDNLPLPVTSFIGRESELETITERLTTTRLLTLTGVGGCGKTRLALELARGVSARYPDGVWLAELGPLANPDLVSLSIAAAVGVRETAETPATSAIVQALRPRHLLLLLDNCEHLLDPCAKLVDELLRSCPEIRVLATSREPLGVTGEAIWRVPSLELPDARVPSNINALMHNPCVRLFVERAQAVQPRFALGPRNAAAVVQICRRLDGIPLALELAAARIDTVTPEQVATRLDQRFRLLTGGARTALPRQQTLVATLNWSYDLLSKAERRLFERLAVFSGGWTLEAAESVCAGPGVASEDVLDLLAQLTRKSLVLAEAAAAGAERYALLESVREYARQRLATRGVGESTALRERHAAFYASLAERLDPELPPGQRHEPGPDLADEQVHVQAEYDNLRSMLAWCLESGRPAPGFRAGSALGRFWMWRGLYSEGSYWLEAFLELDVPSGDASVTPGMRARAVQGAGLFASRQGNYVVARARFETAAAVWRAIDDRVGLAYALSWLGLMAWLTGDSAQASELLDESRRTLEVIDDAAHLSMTLRNMGMVARSQGEYARAADLFRASVVHARGTGFRDSYSVARAFCHLGRTEFLDGDGEQALRHFREGLIVMREVTLAGHTLADCLDWVAAAKGEAGQSVDAARLFGAADAQWQASGAVRYAPERPAYEADLSRVRNQLDPGTFAAAWAEGNAMSAAQALDYALELLAERYEEGPMDR